jgi:tRNA threonylcarbamoyladenosine biosynthesis protein TsaB
MRSGSVILGLDAAGLSISVAVALGETVRATQCHALPHGQAEALLPMVDAVMRAAGLSPESIEIIALTVGPGSFTGIRAGLAAARGIALATGAALIGVTGFEAVAALPAPRGDPDFLLIALESRREDLYLQLFDQDQRPLADPSAVMPADLERWVEMAIGTAGLTIAGDAAGRAAAALAHRASTSVSEPSGPDAVAAIRAASRRRRLGVPDCPARPFYLRPPDVTVAGPPRSGRHSAP